MQKYSKAIIALAGALVAGLAAYYGDTDPLVQTVIGVLTALGVYQTRNKS